MSVLVILSFHNELLAYRITLFARQACMLPGFWLCCASAGAEGVKGGRVQGQRAGVQARVKTAQA